MKSAHCATDIVATLLAIGTAGHQRGDGGGGGGDGGGGGATATAAMHCSARATQLDLKCGVC